MSSAYLKQATTLQGDVRRDELELSWRDIQPSEICGSRDGYRRALIRHLMPCRCAHALGTGQMPDPTRLRSMGNGTNRVAIGVGMYNLDLKRLEYHSR